MPGMRSAIVFGVLVVGLVAGCTDRQEGRSSPGVERPVAAADGTNLDACADGNCEVELSGPVTIPLSGQGGGLVALEVDRLGDSGIEFTTSTSAGSAGSGELAEGCTLTFYEGGGGSSCVSGGEPPRPERETGVLAMQLTAVSDGTVVLLLVAGEPGPPPTSLVPPIPGFPGR